MATPGEARRARRRSATRSTIRLAALRLALEHGLENVTVHMIAEAANIAPRTFFGYFATKDDALRLELSLTAERVAELLAQRPADEPPIRVVREVIKQVISAELTDRMEEMILWRKLARQAGSERGHRLASRRQEVRQDLLGALRQDIAARSGCDDSDLYPALLLATAQTAGQVAIDHWMRDDDPTDDTDIGRLVGLLDQTFDLLEGGLGRPPGH